MKMTIEEKAKAYDSVFKRLKEMYNNNKTNVAAKLVYERYFPELKKSEGEEAIKNIIESLSILISYIEDDASVPDAKAFLIERIEKQIAWLEKQGEQKPAEWSEEDEYCRHQLIVFCENCMVQDDGAKRCAHWLKSLRPQSQWRPSEEQMNALNVAKNSSFDLSYKTKDTLKSLYNDLKKLKD